MKKEVEIGFLTKRVTIPVLKTWVGEINGLENLPKDKPFLLAPNHCSYIEHFLIGAILIPYLNKKLYFIAKKEHFVMSQKFWHNLWKKYVPTIPIDRSNGEEALKTASSYLRKGKIIVIYPEGTRSLTGKIQKGKTGIARLALRSKTPVIPLGIMGTFEILPKGKTMPKIKKAIFNFGKPIYFNKYYNKRMNKIILEEITRKIMKEISKLSNQKYNY